MSLLPAFSNTNSRIKNGSIYSSTIDMGTTGGSTGVITNHGTPVTGLDVVNKAYCDNNNNSGIPSFNITLSGQTWNNILPTTYEGDITLSVKNSVSNGPSARFSLCKSEASRQASIIRWNSMAGLTTEERLEVRWLANSGIEIRKNGPGYDGSYTIKYILND